MELIPVKQLEDSLNDEVIRREHRSYVGLSAVGHNCHRLLQYIHYWAYESSISSRVERLFNVGHAAEDVVIEDLEKVGINVIKRQETICGETGHWKGHWDGLGVYIEHPDFPKFVVEIKTHCNSNFSKLKKGKLVDTYPMHYDQMTAYGGYNDLKLGLYIGLNKDNSEYHFEWVEICYDRFWELKRKQIEVVISDVLLPRIGTGKKTWFECKLCDAKDVCYGDKKPPKSCRTCENVVVIDGGIWRCGYHNYNISLEEQRVGCSAYELGVMFK